MTPAKIISVVERYERQLRMRGIPKERMDPRRTIESLSEDEVLAHAHFLCAGVKEFARDPKRQGKANRHLASVQILLSVVGLYTLEDLMSHNRQRKAAKITAKK